MLAETKYKIGWRTGDILEISPFSCLSKSVVIITLQSKPTSQANDANTEQTKIQKEEPVSFVNSLENSFSSDKFLKENPDKGDLLHRRETKEMRTLTIVDTLDKKQNNNDIPVLLVHSKSRHSSSDPKAIDLR